MKLSRGMRTTTVRKLMRGHWREMERQMDIRWLPGGSAYEVRQYCCFRGCSPEGSLVAVTHAYQTIRKLTQRSENGIHMVRVRESRVESSYVHVGLAAKGSLFMALQKQRVRHASVVVVVGSRVGNDRGVGSLAARAWSLRITTRRRKKQGSVKLPRPGTHAVRAI